MKNTIKLLLATFSVAMLTACGGGGGGSETAGSGGSSSGNITNTTSPVVQQTAEGLWNGIATPGGAIKTLVLANGSYFQFIGTASPVGVMYGTSRVDASNNLIFDTQKGFINGLYEQNNAVSNSVVLTGSTLNYTIARNSSTPRVITHTYDASYNTPFTQVSLVGNYSGATVGQNSAFSIDLNGNITGTAARSIVTGGCQITGMITANTNKRYGVVSINGCSDSVDGVGIALVVGSGVGQQIYIGTQGQYGYSLYGIKQ